MARPIVPYCRHCGARFVKACNNQVFCSDECRFWSRVDKSAGPDCCWIWQGAVTKDYGVMCIGGTNYRVHRFALELRIGKLQPGICACHECDNPVCVNPGHLFPGTVQDNVDDMIAKGRKRGPKTPEARERISSGWRLSYTAASRQKSSQTKRAKFFERKGLPPDIASIMRKARDDGMTLDAIGAQYGVCGATVMNWCADKTR